MLTLAITLGVTVIPAESIGAVAASLALVVGLAVSLSRRRAAGQTTLRGAWWWSVAALAAWSSVEIGAHLPGGRSAGGILPPLRMAAMALSFCPVVALVGAKRPQHRAWSFVVLSLWGIVLLPAAENFFLHRGQRLDVGDARSWFLWILILLGPINFVPTRYWPASLLFMCGQIMAFSPYLALVRQPIVSGAETAGLVCCVLSMGIAWFISRRETASRNAYDRLWLDFRDSFGLFWALRVQERINALARQSGSEVELHWTGFRRSNGTGVLTTAETDRSPGLRAAFKGLLRRFVSGPWIARRLDEQRV